MFNRSGRGSPPNSAMCIEKVLWEDPASNYRDTGVCVEEEKDEDGGGIFKLLDLLLVDYR